MILKNTKKHALIALCAIVLVCLFAIIGLNARASADVSFEEYYTYGQTLKIPQKPVTVNGTEYSSEAVVVYPDGTAMRDSSVTLNMSGNYKVEYRVTVGGETYKDVYAFTVKTPLVTLGSRNDSAEYGYVEGYENVKGLNVRAAQGSTVKINQIIDLSEMGEDENLISLFVVPETFGALDSTTVVVKVEEAADPSNYFIVRMRRSATDNNIVYIQAGAHNQSKTYGASQGVTTSALYTNAYGFTVTSSFYGEHFGEEKYKISLRYDNATQTVYGSNHYLDRGDYIIDFNNSRCFTDGWSGFKTDKVRVSVYGEDFLKNSVGVLITHLAQTDLTKATLDITEVEGPTVDFGEYTEDDYPYGAVGKKYKLFGATSENLYSTEKIYTRVYTSYGSTAQKNVDCSDGYFIPTAAEIYTIEYTCVDAFGNVGKTVVPITVKEKAEAIAFSVDETPVVSSIGQYINLPKISSVTGGSGKVTTTVKLKNLSTDEEKIITDDNVYLDKIGSYSIVYLAEDYIGNTTEKTISLTVNKADAPIFYGEPILPKYYLQNGKYSVPTYEAVYFVDNDKRAATVTTEVQSGGKTLTIENGCFTVENGDSVTLVYTATDANNQKTEKRFIVPTKNVGLGGQLDMSKYFDCEGGTASAGDSYVGLTASGAEASYSFIREMYGATLEVMLDIDSAKNNYEAIKIIVEDYADSGKTVEITLRKTENGKIALSANGTIEKETDYKFGGDIRKISVKLTDTALTLGETKVYISAYSDGTPFNGFDDYVYVTIKTVGCSGEAELRVVQLNGQTLNNYKTDVWSPNVIFTGDYGGEKEINSEHVINPVKALDILNPYTEITFSVKTPSKADAVSTDGTTLKNVSAANAYTLVLSEYGRYVFTYTYKDGADNEETFSYIVYCNDKIDPELTVKETEISGKVGKAIKVPSYTCKDNYTTEENLTVVIQIINPDGIIENYGDSYVPEKAGTYTIRYLAFDENYNMVTADVVCNVK